MKSMAQVSETIWETCKTYLFTQGKFLAILWVLIAALHGLLFSDGTATRAPSGTWS
jgi:Na+/H+-translocating membrane pyrophosphatase